MIEYVVEKRGYMAEEKKNKNMVEGREYIAEEKKLKNIVKDI